MMEHWGVWDWTKFICCNHRPIEAERIASYQLTKNGQDYCDINVNSPQQYDYQYYYADLPLDSDTNNANIMDGLRIQLHKRSKGVSLRSPPVRRTNESQVTLRGWLYRLEGAALKQWKRRWFVLADYCLFYYKDMEEAKLIGSLLLPSYKITPCLSEDGIARKFAFKAEHSNMKTYYFAADSKESMTQWMNSLSLASIMQLSSAFSTVRNQGDGQEVGNGDREDEEESGFVSYQSRRLGSGTIISSPYDTNISSDDKYPGSYNSVGLPIAYPQHQHQQHHHQQQHQQHIHQSQSHRAIQRSHYVNAPPKPKRQYYENSDLYVIPPSAQYHQQLHATPDLIAHDSYNSNYLPSYYTQSYSYDQPISTSPQYRLPLPSQTRLSRLPPRPHSADFLERDQEELEDEESFQKIIASPTYNSRNDKYYIPSPPDPPKIMPIRPKSSLERYDPYSRYYYDQSNYNSPQFVSSNSNTKTEPRPWSDYLVTANNMPSPRNDNQLQNSSFHLMQSSLYRAANNNNYQTDLTPRNYQKEESLQRLLEWKQRMLQSPLNKRNWTQPQSQSQLISQQSTKCELPSRPPLPEEYRSKFAIKDALKAPQFSQRERSKSSGDGSEFNELANDTELRSPQKNVSVSYSSDDEAELSLRSSFVRKMRGTPSQLTSTCDQFRLQMESEEKMIETEAHKREEHKQKYREVREHLTECEKQYDMQYPLINNMVDSMANLNIPQSNDGFNENKANAASASILLEEQTSNLSSLQQDKEILERTLEGVKNKVAKMDTESGIEAVVNLEKLKKQQRVLETELNRVCGLLTPDYINIHSLINEKRDKKCDIDISKEDYYRSSTMFYPRHSQSGRESMIMSPISFNESINSKLNDTSTSLERFTQGWDDTRVSTQVWEIPDKPFATRTASRRSFIKQVNTPSIDQNLSNSITKPCIKLEKREDGDGVDELSFKGLIEKFDYKETKTLETNSSQSKIQSFPEINSNKTLNLSFETPKSQIKSYSYIKSYVSDSEILDNNSGADESDTITTKSAPIMLSPLSCVLADLRKTADVRKEKLYLSSKISLNSQKVDEVIVTNGALHLLGDENVEKIDKQDLNSDDYMKMDNIVKNEAEYVSMDGEEIEKESDGIADDADDADDEASRDFDSLNYQTEIITDSNDIKIKPGCKVRTYKKPRSEPIVPLTSLTADAYQCSSHIAKEYLNPNPAYETFDEIRIGNDTTETKSVSINPSQPIETNDKQRSPNAPYYYSDLLSEEQQIALQERLASYQSGSPPPLLSRCNALNNTRFLGTTSLQKTDIGKRVNNIMNSIDRNDSSFVANNSAIAQNSIESSIQSILSPNPSKFFDAQRNEYEAGHTLKKVPEMDKSFSSWKRCITPDINHLKAKIDHSFMLENNAQNSAFCPQRRSKSLEGLVEQQNSHIYENFDLHLSDNESNSNDNIDDDYMDIEMLRTVSRTHFSGENFRGFARNKSQCAHNVPLVERLEKSFDDYSETDSDLSSLLELDSVSGPVMVEKVRKRRTSHKRRSKDDLNASDSEIQRNAILSKPMHVKPKSLRDSKGTRLCVSTGDLLGKSHEELVLLLIQLRRTQSQLAKTCDQFRLQMESEEKMIEIEPHKREEHKQKYREVRERLTECEKQYDMQFPLINMVDNMVKLNIPQSNEEFNENKAKAASTSILDQVSLEEETSNLSALQQDKEILERTLEGVKNKVAKMDTESGSGLVVNLEKLKKQQRVIEAELNRVRGLLTHSAKKLEEKAAENAQMEQEVQIAKNKLKQVLANEQEVLESQKAATLEAELEHINQVIDDLHLRRKELNAAIENLKISDKKREVVRASPTGIAGGIPLPGKKRVTTSFMETDLDSMESRDLAHCPRNSGSEGEDTPLYENLEANNSDQCIYQFQSNEELLIGNAEDIINEQMKQFYGIMPQQKGSEIKTVRIVKRESERRRIHFANGSKSNDYYWNQDNEFGGVVGAVGGYGTSIPPPYYYDDKNEGANDGHNNSDECSDGKHCSAIELDADFNANSANKVIPYLNEKQQQMQHIELYCQPDCERIRSASLSLPSTSSNSSLLTCSPFSFRLTHIRQLESKYGKLSTTRRHHTISSSQPQLSKTSNSVSSMWHTCDDTDMELRLRNSLNTPDVVKSTIKKNEDFDEKFIEREIMLPQKIEIPERYIPDEEPEEISASEKLKRSMKAEMIRRMLSESTAYEDVRRDTQQTASSSSSSSAVGDETKESKVKLSEEKRRRAQLLALNHELAKEVMERSRIVAVLGSLTKFNRTNNTSRERLINEDIDQMLTEWSKSNQ